MMRPARNRWMPWMRSRMLNILVALAVSPGLTAPPVLAWSLADDFRPLGGAKTGTLQEGNLALVRASLLRPEDLQFQKALTTPGRIALSLAPHLLDPHLSPTDLFTAMTTLGSQLRAIEAYHEAVAQNRGTTPAEASGKTPVQFVWKTEAEAAQFAAFLARVQQDPELAKIFPVQPAWFSTVEGGAVQDRTRFPLRQWVGLSAEAADQLLRDAVWSEKASGPSLEEAYRVEPAKFFPYMDPQGGIFLIKDGRHFLLMRGEGPTREVRNFGTTANGSTPLTDQQGYLSRGYTLIFIAPEKLPQLPSLAEDGKTQAAAVPEGKAAGLPGAGQALLPPISAILDPAGQAQTAVLDRGGQFYPAGGRPIDIRLYKDQRQRTTPPGLASYPWLDTLTTILSKASDVAQRELDALSEEIAESISFPLSILPKASNEGVLVGLSDSLAHLYNRLTPQPIVRDALFNLLKRKENQRLRIVVVKAGMLGNQMARYYDATASEAIIAIDKAFYFFTFEDDSPGGERVFIERFLHELAHDNAIGTPQEELEEEARVLRQVDYLLYEALGAQPDPEVERFLTNLPADVKPFISGKSKYELFARLHSETDGQSAQERERILSQALTAYAHEVTSHDLRRFGKAVGLPQIQPDVPSTYIVAQRVTPQVGSGTTGEVSVRDARAAGATAFMGWHSDTRPETPSAIKENLENVKAVMRIALEAGEPFTLFLGGKGLADETALIAERDRIMEEQFRFVTEGLTPELLSNLILVFEPVSYISVQGKGKEAPLANIQQAHATLRQIVKDVHGAEVAQNMRILYGGSSNPGNAEAILSLDDVDGLVPGAASSSSEKFLAMLDIMERLARTMKPRPAVRWS